MKKQIVDFLDSRLGIRDLLEQNLTKYLLPRNTNVWYTLGAVLITLFMIQIATGILLLIYYVPNPAEAFESVERIMNEVPFGWLIRTLHAVGANIIIIALLLHMLSVMFMASYKKPRELTWLSGFLILNLAFALCLTGYLLPWSQLSFWATTVATDAAGAIPVVGDELVRFLRGGSHGQRGHPGTFLCSACHGIATTARRLGRFSPVLCAAIRDLPPAVRGRVRTARLSRPSSSMKNIPGGIPFFPELRDQRHRRYLLFPGVFSGDRFLCAELFFPETAFEPADPFVTPPHIKPEWYFLWAYQTLKIFPSEIIGLGIQGLFMTFLALLPFIDRGGESRPVKRPLFVTCYVLGILLFVAISIWGHYS